MPVYPSLMAVHPRKTIREKIVTLLTAGVTSAAGRVYDSRDKQPIQTAPFVVVRTTADESLAGDIINLALPRHQRQLTVEIDVVDTERPSSGTLAGDADDLAREIEETLSVNPTLDGLALSCLYSVSILEEGLEVDPPAYRVGMTYLVLYEDALGAP